MQARTSLPVAGALAGRTGAVPIWWPGADRGRPGHGGRRGRRAAAIGATQQVHAAGDGGHGPGDARHRHRLHRVQRGAAQHGTRPARLARNRAVGDQRLCRRVRGGHRHRRPSGGHAGAAHSLFHRRRDLRGVLPGWRARSGRHHADRVPCGDGSRRRAGIFALSFLQVHSGFAWLVPGMVVTGAGVGLFYSSISTAAITALDPARASLAGGVVYMCQVGVGRSAWPSTPPSWLGHHRLVHTRDS